MGKLSDKVAIITGAASGIGHAAAMRFAAEGAQLVLCDRNPDIHDVCRSVALKGRQAIACQADAACESAIQEIVATTIKEFGRLDVAFANAGILGDVSGIFDCDPAAWLETLRINLIGPAMMIKHAGKVMVDQGHGGAIILTASVAGINSGAGPSPYSASKAGVINLTKVAAQQMSTSGVRVNAICPGLTQTSMTQSTFDIAREREKTHKLGHLNPLRRPAQSAEVANVALFLASDESSYVNGQAIVVDGGLSSSLPVTRQMLGQTAF